jgi:hypothetical protein
MLRDVNRPLARANSSIAREVSIPCAFSYHSPGRPLSRCHIASSR